MELYNKAFKIESTNDIVGYFKENGYDLFEQNTTNYSELESTTIKIGNQYYDVTVYVTMIGAWQDVGDKLYTIDTINRVTYDEILYDDLVARVNAATHSQIAFHENRIEELKKELVF